MSENISIPSRLQRQNQHLFIGGREIYGVQSIDISYNLGAQPLTHLGNSQTYEFPSAAQTANVSVSMLMVDTDPIQQYTGNYGFNGYVVKTVATPTSDNFSFTSGFLNSYSFRCAVGQIPEISADITAFGNAGFISNGYSAQTDSDFTAISTYSSGLVQKIPSYGTIDVSIDDFATNRLQSFSVSITSDRVPVYGIGSRYPTAVNLTYPLEVIASFRIDKNDYLAYKMNSYPCSPITKNLTLSFSDYQTNTAITSYSFSNMALQGLKYSTDVNGNVGVDFQYRGYINGPAASFPSDLRADTTLFTADDTYLTADYYV